MAEDKEIATKEETASEEKVAGKAEAKPKRKKAKREVSNAIGRIQCSFNNTIITITDPKGQVLCWSSAGKRGFKGARKSTPFAAQVAAEEAARTAADQFGVRTLSVYVTGPGAGRETALRGLQVPGVRVSFIRDITPIPHNGCRPEKRRRV